jgi:hypothetical protein
MSEADVRKLKEITEADVRKLIGMREADIRKLIYMSEARSWLGGMELVFFKVYGEILCKFGQKNFISVNQRPGSASEFCGQFQEKLFQKEIKAFETKSYPKFDKSTRNVCRYINIILVKAVGETRDR